MRKVVVLAALAAAISSGAAQAQRPQAYPLKCRAGGAMNVMFAPSTGYLSLVPSKDSCRKTLGGVECDYRNYSVLSSSRLIIEFSTAPQGANLANPGAGECAWLDRAVGPEPRYTMTYPQRAPVGEQQFVPMFEGDGRGAFRFAGLSGGDRRLPPAADVQVIMSALESGGFFTVYAFGTSSGLEIVGVSPDAEGPQ